MSARVWFAALLSVVTAFLYALSNVLELLEAEQVPDELAMRPGLLLRLVRRPRWLLGVACDVVGFVSQAGALALAAVVFVEPILATGILMALFLGSAFLHRPVERSVWVAAVMLSAGLAMFLYEVSPTGGRDIASRARWVIAGPAVLAVIILCMALARTMRGPKRAALLGIAAGISFGVSALLTKALVHYLGDGILGWVDHWEPYALAVSSIGGVIVAQSAFQTGALGASVGATEAMGPISATALGLGLLDERVAVSGVARPVAVALSVAAMLSGISMLARAEERLMNPEPVA